MSNHSFMFLDDDFKDISKFCMRMEKNIVEGDGVDAVIWAGKIAELLTHYISSFVNLDLRNYEQNKKLLILLNKELISEEIYDQLDSIRQYRNIATHHDLNNEIQTALKVHKMVFNILCWFYGVYKADNSILNLKYPGVTYKHDENFINNLKNNIFASQGNSQNISFAQHNVDYNVHDLFNQNNVYFNEDLGKYTAYIMDNGKKITIGHFKTKEVAVRKGYNFVMSDDFKIYKNFDLKPEKLENGKYSDRKGIDYDEDKGLWTAQFNKTNLGYFISQNIAVIARKEYIDTLPLPKPKNGSYSDYKEITFDLNHKLWCIKKDGEILDYYDSEEEAIYNLINVLNLSIPLEELGIVKDEDGLRWRIYFKNKYVATRYSEKEAINKRLEYVSSFAQPKRNKNGEFSIHKGIFYDEKNLIWVLSIKGEILGFFDSEEEAFNFKKEFLKSKGFDVSNFKFNEEESFDENFDFKVKINSDDNAIVYNEDSDEWIVYFRGNEIDRCNTEADAKRSRKDYLRSMPYPPRKEDNKYSSFEGIDYDIEHHLWTAEYNDESLGYFDSEEDAFYALKDHLVKEGVDVSEMHFKEIEELNDNDSSVNDVDSDLKMESSLDDETNEKKFISYYDVFKDKDDSPSDSLLKEEDLESLTDDLENESNKISNRNIEEYKGNSFYGMANKVNNLDISDELSVYDLESDDEENDLFDDIEMEEVDSDVADRFSKQKNKHLNLNHKSFKENLFNRNLSYNNRDFKEIKFNSYDSNNFRREIILSYNEEELFISLEGMITRDELKEILSKDYFNNTDELNYKKEDDDLFSIFINLQYDLLSMDLNCLLDIFSTFAWEFDLLNRLLSKEDSNVNMDEGIVSILSPKGKANLIKEDKDNETVSESKDYLNASNVSRRKVLTKQENLISSKNKKSNSKTAKAIIRGGVRVSLEEAEKMANAKEEKEIKSNIIDKKPEIKKEFRTTSLGTVLDLNRHNEEKEEIDPEDGMDSYVESDLPDENLIYDDGEAFSEDSDLIVEEEVDYLDLEGTEDYGLNDNSLNLNFDNGYIDSDEDSLDDNLDYGDVADENGANTNLSFDDIFDDEDDELSFEDELDNYDVIDSDDLSENSDLEENSDDFSSNSSINSLYAEPSNEEAVTIPKKVKKPKKPKKEKRVSADAFDEKFKNSYEIEYDEENDKWLAYIGGNFFKSFDTPKEAVIERKKIIRRNVPLPRKGLDGRYTDEEGIDFDLKERIWTVSLNGVIVAFAVSEKDAVFKRNVFNLILEKLEIDSEDFNEDKFNEIKEMDLTALFNDLNEEDFEEKGLSSKDVNKKFNRI